MSLVSLVVQKLCVQNRLRRMCSLREACAPPQCAGTAATGSSKRKRHEIHLGS